jgi:hypothetical protein
LGRRGRGEGFHQEISSVREAFRISHIDPWRDLPGLAALLYSLIESAKLAGVEPRAYLGEAPRQAIRNPGTVTLARDFK